MAKAKDSQVAAEAAEDASVEEVKELKTRENTGKDIVEINCFTPVTINGKEFFGVVKVTRSEAESINEMLSKKKATDSRISVGREFERTRVDGTLVVRDAHTKQRVDIT